MLGRTGVVLLNEKEKLAVMDQALSGEVEQMLPP